MNIWHILCNPLCCRFEAEQIACNKQYETDLQSMVDSQKKQVLQRRDRTMKDE